MNRIKALTALAALEDLLRSGTPKHRNIAREVLYRVCAGDQLAVEQRITLEDVYNKLYPEKK